MPQKHGRRMQDGRNEVYNPNECDKRKWHSICSRKRTAKSTGEKNTCFDDECVRDRYSFV